MGWRFATSLISAAIPGRPAWSQHSIPGQRARRARERQSVGLSLDVHLSLHFHHSQQQPQLSLHCASLRICITGRHQCLREFVWPPSSIRTRSTAQPFLRRVRVAACSPSQPAQGGHSQVAKLCTFLLVNGPTTSNQPYRRASRPPLDPAPARPSASSPCRALSSAPARQSRKGHDKQSPLLDSSTSLAHILSSTRYDDLLIELTSSSSSARAYATVDTIPSLCAAIH